VWGLDAPTPSSLLAELIRQDAFGTPGDRLGSETSARLPRSNRGGSRRLDGRALPRHDRTGTDPPRNHRMSETRCRSTTLPERTCVADGRAARPSSSVERSAMDRSRSCAGYCDSGSAPSAPTSGTPTSRGSGDSATPVEVGDRTAPSGYRRSSYAVRRAFPCSDCRTSGAGPVAGSTVRAPRGRRRRARSHRARSAFRRRRRLHLLLVHGDHVPLGPRVDK
jgi:hypothetical protein